MPRIIYQEFRDEFENTKYPFMDNATLTDSSQAITLPNSIFLDAGFCFPEGFPYLSRIEVGSSKVILTVTSGSVDAMCEVSLDAIPDVLYFKNDQSKTFGCIVSEKSRLNWLAVLETGTYEFYPEATSFAIRCNLQSQVLGVSTIGAGDKAYSGDVWLVGMNGIYLKREDSTTISINALGEVLYKRKNCVDSNAFKTPRYLKTVNGIASDIYGNLFISLAPGDKATRVRLNSTPDGIEVKRI